MIGLVSTSKATYAKRIIHRSPGSCRHYNVLLHAFISPTITTTHHLRILSPICPVVHSALICHCSRDSYTHGIFLKPNSCRVPRSLTNRIPWSQPSKLNLSISGNTQETFCGVGVQKARWWTATGSYTSGADMGVISWAVLKRWAYSAMVGR
jgi:hypothetical protein